MVTVNSLLSSYCSTVRSHLYSWNQSSTGYFTWTHLFTHCTYLFFHSFYWQWVEEKSYYSIQIADSPTDSTTAIFCRRVTLWEMSSDFPVTSAIEFSYVVCQTYRKASREVSIFRSKRVAPRPGDAITAFLTPMKIHYIHRCNTHVYNTFCKITKETD
jgi:hypothetical protein